MHRRPRSRRGLGQMEGSADAIANDQLARAIVDWCGFFESCDLDACVRARRCRGARVPCFDAEACYQLLAEMPVGQQLFEAAVAAEEDALFE